jgi:DnaJ-class molecular chaperone
MITAKLISLASLNPKKVPEEVTIKILEKQYEPSNFPHIKIIRKLTEVSNDSELATSFHRTMQTICRGCHHQSIVEAEAKDNKPPYCRNCHSIVFDTKNPNRPRLLAAYHRQCLTCHEKMDIKEKGCADCHKEKVPQPKDLLTDTDNMHTISQRGV